jgi:hypothetical protein
MTRPCLSDDPRPARALACAVLLTAWRDLTGWEPWHQRTAQAFFADPEALAPWCALAGLDVRTVQQRVEHALLAAADGRRAGQRCLFERAMR